MERTVLGIDGDDLGSRGQPGPLDDRCPGDQRFLVGQGQPTSGLQGGQGDRKPGEAHHGVHHHLAQGGDGGQSLDSGDDIDPRWQGGGQDRRQRGVPDGHHLWMQLVGLSGQEVDRAPCPQRHHPEAVGLGTDHVDGLGADRTRGPHDADRHRLVRSPLAARHRRGPFPHLTRGGAL